MNVQIAGSGGSPIAKHRQLCRSASALNQILASTCGEGSGRDLALRVLCLEE
jgi:hypothetical protein